MSLLSRAFGVRPSRPYAVRFDRDLVIPAGDGVPLLANRCYPVDVDRPPLILLRSPYGRGAALDRMPQLLAERGYQVLYVSLRGTDGSGGDFDGFTINPADADGMLSWLREQPWFGGVLATWGASYLGFAQWELAARDIPEWKLAVSAGCSPTTQRMRAAGRTVRLLIGPWAHGRGLFTRAGMGDALGALDAALSEGTPLSGVRVFVTGSRRWIGLADWPPPARDTANYLHPAGRLSTQPAATGPPSRFRYDPADPTPSLAGTAVALSGGPTDNRRLEARPDVLTFTSDPRAADLEVIGPVRVRLHVQASVAHIDLHARLCDVSPRGRSINISDGILRLTDVAPDTPQPVEFELWPVAHAFRRGHQIRLQVSGAAHPRYGRNHGTPEPLATSTRLQASDRTVLHDAQHPSAVWLPVPG